MLRAESVEGQKVCVVRVVKMGTEDVSHAEVKLYRTQMLCSGHNDKGVQMKTCDERVPDSVSGWIVNHT